MKFTIGSTSSYGFNFQIEQWCESRNKHFQYIKSLVDVYVIHLHERTPWMRVIDALTRNLEIHNDGNFFTNFYWNEAAFDMPIHLFPVIWQPHFRYQGFKANVMIPIAVKYSRWNHLYFECVMD